MPPLSATQAAPSAPPALPDFTAMAALGRRLCAAIPQLQLPCHTLHLLQIRPYQMPRGWSICEHQHSVYEANILLHGQAREPGADSQVLGPGHVFFHGPHTPHAWGAPDADCLRLILAFTVSPVLRVPRPVAWPCWPELLEDIAKLFALTAAAAPGWSDRAAARLAVILSQLLTLADLPKETVPPPRQSEDLVATVDAFLADNLRHPLRLDDIAAHASVSVSTLTHRYLERTGRSVGKHLLSLRLEEAAHLLSSTDEPLKTISSTVGLGDPSYLCRLFKRYFRTTPLAYRHAHRA